MSRRFPDATDIAHRVPSRTRLVRFNEVVGFAASRGLRLRRPAAERREGTLPSPGMKDVARQAGVSVGTVSNVLNRPDLVAPDTRRRVLGAIDALGFVRNESARQLRAGFPWLTFDRELEREFRRAHLDENLLHTRVNWCMAVVITIAFTAMQSIVLGPQGNRIPGLIHMLVIIPMLLIGLMSSFLPQRHRIYPPVAMVASTTLGLGMVAIQIIATKGGIATLFPCLMLTIIFIYFMGGLIFYHALAANMIVLFVYLAAGTTLQLPGGEFAYDAMAMIAAKCPQYEVTVVDTIASSNRVGGSGPGVGGGMTLPEYPAG